MKSIRFTLVLISFLWMLGCASKIPFDGKISKPGNAIVIGELESNTDSVVNFSVAEKDALLVLDHYSIFSYQEL